MGGLPEASAAFEHPLWHPYGPGEMVAPSTHGAQRDTYTNQIAPVWVTQPWVSERSAPGTPDGCKEPVTGSSGWRRRGRDDAQMGNAGTDNPSAVHSSA